MASKEPLDGHHVLRVLPEYRPHRGKYWAVGGWGYTDDLLEAGTWFGDELPRSTRAEAVTMGQAARDELIELAGGSHA